MAKFQYKAKNDKGEIVSGTVNASNESEAERVLYKNKLFATEIRADSVFAVKSIFSKKVSLHDKAIFARQMATMIDSGLTLTKSLSIEVTQTENERLKDIYQELYTDLQQGNSFSTALSKHPEAFDQVFVSVVKSGETTGNLGIVLKQMADRYEKDYDFISKIKSAMYYPAFILLALIGIAVYMLMKVIPQLETLFSQSGADLPVATSMLLSASDFMVSKWWLVLILLVVTVYLIRLWAKTDIGEKTIDRWQIELPGLKGLMEGIYMSRFSRVMEMLIQAGVPILDALKISASTMNNVLYKESLEDMVTDVEKGVSLSVPLQKEKIFPPLVGQMVGVGEQTGKLDKIMGKIGSFYEEEAGRKIKTVSSLVEPIVLVIIGAGVAFLIFAVLLPIYNIAQLQ